MRKGTLGTDYAGGEVIVREGESGDCMYVVQGGEVEVVQSGSDGEQRLALLTAGDLFGEMAIFERQPRSATVRAVGDGARVLKLDKKALLRRIADDPLLALNMLEKLSARLRDANQQLAHYAEHDGR
ncbi:MAG TPA: cyclic nucleotide-binding domain-containing protein [Gaiellaceae bacterium]|nr:cyclic nucleotide-binding domain-containing protein [Gaiellaceae bacterium]